MFLISAVPGPGFGRYRFIQKVRRKPFAVNAPANPVKSPVSPVTDRQEPTSALHEKTELFHVVDNQVGKFGRNTAPFLNFLTMHPRISRSMGHSKNGEFCICQWIPL